MATNATILHFSIWVEKLLTTFSKARPRPANVAPGPSVPAGPPGPPSAQGPIGHPGPHGAVNQQGPPPGAPGFGYFPPHMAGWGRAGGPPPGAYGGMPYPPPGWFPPGQEFPPMAPGPWNPYGYTPGPSGHPGGPAAPSAPGAPGQSRQSANQTPSNQPPTQKPAPIGPAADKKPPTPAQPADKMPTEPKTLSQASKQPVAPQAPPPPIESKPTVEEVKATAASLSNNTPVAAGASREPAKTIPTGPKSSRPTQILPAVPLPAALTAKAAQQSQAAPKPISEQNSAAAAAAALRDAAQAAKEAVAVAMAKLDTSSTAQQPESTVDNLTRKVNEMRMEAARTGQANRGGRGRGPRPAKVEVPDTDFDFASANAKFNKQEVVKEAIAGSSVAETTNGNAAKPEAAGNSPAPAEPAYNKAKSFFDNISSESKDRENAGQKPGGREWRGEEQRKNIETFGQGSVDGGYRGYRGGRGRGRGGRGRGYRGGRGTNGGFRQQREAQPAAQ